MERKKQLLFAPKNSAHQRENNKEENKKINWIYGEQRKNRIEHMRDGISFEILESTKIKHKEKLINKQQKQLNTSTVEKQHQKSLLTRLSS